MSKQRPNYGSYSEQIQKILKEKQPELYAKQQKKKAAWKKWHGSEEQRKAGINFATNVATISGGPAMFNWLLKAGPYAKRLYDALSAAKKVNNTKQITKVTKQINEFKKKYDKTKQSGLNKNKVNVNKDSVKNLKNKIDATKKKVNNTSKPKNQTNNKVSSASKNNQSKIASNKKNTTKNKTTKNNKQPKKGDTKLTAAGKKIWNGVKWVSYAGGTAGGIWGIASLISKSEGDKKKNTTSSSNKNKSKTINKIKNAGKRKAPTRADDIARSKQHKSKNTKKSSYSMSDSQKKSQISSSVKPKYSGKHIGKDGEVAYDSVGDFFRHMTGNQKEKAAPKDMKIVKAETKGATKGLRYSKQKSNTKASGGKHIKTSRYYSGGGHIFTGR